MYFSFWTGWGTGVREEQVPALIATERSSDTTGLCSRSDSRRATYPGACRSLEFGFLRLGSLFPPRICLVHLLAQRFAPGDVRRQFLRSLILLICLFGLLQQEVDFLPQLGVQLLGPPVVDALVFGGIGPNASPIRAEQAQSEQFEFPEQFQHLRPTFQAGLLRWLAS
jgi:hypothetical protein